MNENDFKINLVYHDLEGNIAIERIWAEKENEYYRVKNIPFFAPNIAFNDLICVENDEGELYFDSLIEPSGHSTVQIIFFKSEYCKQVTTALNGLKCDWEGSHVKEYISVDIPINTNYFEVKDYLNRQREDGILDYQEACLAENHRGKRAIDLEK